MKKKLIVCFISTIAIVIPIISSLCFHGIGRDKSSLSSDAAKNGEPRSASSLQQNKSRIAIGNSASNNTSPRQENEVLLHRAAQNRLKYIEKLGHLPDNPSSEDWLCAQRTTWWGTPIDPQIFWSNKVMWLDSAAIDAAHVHGRLYPPMPYYDAVVKGYSPSNRVSHLDDITPNDPGPHFVGDGGAEAGFWEKFSASHPRPPARIRQEQAERYRKLLRLRERLAKDNPITYSYRYDNEHLLKMIIPPSNYPIEAFTEEALYLGYIDEKRSEYENRVAMAHGMQPVHAPVGLLVSAELITNALPPELEIRRSSWKYDYVVRLKKEGCAQVYIDAYTKEWGLTNEAEWARAAASVAVPPSTPPSK